MAENEVTIPDGDGSKERPYTLEQVKEIVEEYGMKSFFGKETIWIKREVIDWKSKLIIKSEEYEIFGSIEEIKGEFYEMSGYRRNVPEIRLKPAIFLDEIFSLFEEDYQGCIFTNIVNVSPLMGDVERSKMDFSNAIFLKNSDFFDFDGNFEIKFVGTKFHGFATVTNCKIKDLIMRYVFSERGIYISYSEVNSIIINFSRFIKGFSIDNTKFNYGFFSFNTEYQEKFSLQYSQIKKKLLFSASKILLDASLQETNIEGDAELFDYDIKKDFSKDINSKFFFTLKNALERNGHNEEYLDMHRKYKEALQREMEQSFEKEKDKKEKRKLKGQILFSKLMDITSRHFTDWTQTLKCMAWVIGGMSVVYFISNGFQNGNWGYVWSPEKILCTGSKFLDGLCYIGLNLFNSLYFSIITFTTVGYGDIQPTGFLKIVAGAEGFVGVLLCSLFMVTLAKRELG